MVHFSLFKNISTHNVVKTLILVTGVDRVVALHDQIIEAQMQSNQLSLFPSNRLRFWNSTESYPEI
jgi:hypothetical protein